MSYSLVSNARVYPSNLEQKLELDKVKGLIKRYCNGVLSSESVDQLMPLAKFKDVFEKQEEIRECLGLYLSAKVFPVTRIPDLPSFIQKLKIEGSVLTEEEIVAILKILVQYFELTNFIKNHEQQLPILFLKIKNSPAEKSLIDKINRVIGEDGKVRSNATKELQQLSTLLGNQQVQTRKRLESILRDAKNKGWSPDTGITIRENRLVIPILAEYKRKIKGIIHDESASGQTVYLEPTEVVDLNNDLLNTEMAILREIRRILLVLTSEIAPYAEPISQTYELVSYLDFMHAICMYSLDIEANCPRVSKIDTVNLLGARHPILYSHLRKQKRKTIPLNLELSATERILVISGPNAGGKSIAMKTMGLLQLMFQCGLPISASPDSELPVYEHFMADIGDEQSIENDLSTYSSHLTHMRYFLENANPQSLFLVDEFGTGTDPQMGGPIAEAILEQLSLSGARGTVNTHYSNLKLFAGTHKGVVNGCMLFDTEKLSPLFMLEKGRPGSSYAFEIGRKIGLSSTLLDKARSKMDHSLQDFENLLIATDKQKSENEGLQHLLLSKDLILNEVIEKYEKQSLELENSKRQILAKAKEQANAVILKANQQVQELLKQIKTTQKVDVVSPKVVLKQIQTEVDTHFESKRPEVKKNEDLPLKVGDYVRILNGKNKGIVQIIRGKQALVESEDLKIWIKTDELEKLQQQPSKNQSKAGNAQQKIAETQTEFSSNLDLRGKRGEEAIFEMEKVLDQAVITGISEIRVLHGKGDGILRKLIREYLRGYPYFSNFRSEHADLGGDGITIVTLKS